MKAFFLLLKIKTVGHISLSPTDDRVLKKIF
ncbi:hypothetical protein SAMN05518672_108148 [Chitinophaga sp. CF118]|nr:hypothetical protein SAMN05518672_108148 [Chitinophaga sp. CF118]